MANLASAMALQTDFSDCDLRGVKLDCANMAGALLRCARLGPISLVGVVGQRVFASLKEVRLDGADLSGADLEGADLSRASLCNANLRDARLAGTSFVDADLSGADLRGAALDEADLRGAVGLPPPTPEPESSKKRGASA
jgi:uncharacterized protein YjbI with pentapeptide repeats